MILELRRKLDLFRRKGGKTSRRKTTARIDYVVKWVDRPPEQIGKRHVYEFYEAHGFAPSTERDYHYALCHLWRMLDRNGLPPKPPSLREEPTRL